MSKVVETYAMAANTSMLTSLACIFSTQLENIGIVGVEVIGGNEADVAELVTYDKRYFKEGVNVYGITHIDVRKETDMYEKVMTPLVGDR